MPLWSVPSLLGLGDDEIDTSTQEAISVEEAVVDIPMPEIGDLPARNIKVILANSNRKCLEVMATVEQLDYLSKVLGYHIEHADALAASTMSKGAPAHGGGGVNADDEIVSDVSGDAA